MMPSIRTKLLFAYFLGALLMVVTSGYAIYSLYVLTQKAGRIINVEFEAVEISRNMMGILLRMEESAKKYLVLKEPALADIYWARSREGDLLLQRINMLGDVTKGEVLELKDKKETYDRLFLDMARIVGEKGDFDVPQAFARQTDSLMDDMIQIIKKWERQGEQKIDRGMKEINVKSYDAMRLTVILASASLILGLTMAVFIIVSISLPLRKLKMAAVQIGEGNLDVKVTVNRQDEIGHLARAFNFMTERLKELEAMHLDASPLTGLPGNLAIEREIARRLQGGTRFSLCHIDLDNFKPFADAYGYAWGSEVIKETANLIEEARNKEGSPEDFIGHIGGDDFVMVADPERALRMSDYIVKSFGERTARFYAEEDRKAGYIVAPDRKGERQQFPLVTITISIVTDDGSTFKNPVEMARAVAEVKAVGKTKSGSIFLTREEITK